MVRKYGRTISIVEIAFCLSWQHSAPFSPFFFHDHAIAGSEILLCIIKFIYTEKATNFCEISTVNLSYVLTVDISQNFVAFSVYIIFNKELIKANSRKLTCNSGHIKRVDTSILVLSAGLGESRPNWGRLYNHKDPLSSPQQINPLPKIQRKIKHLISLLTTTE